MLRQLAQHFELILYTSGDNEYAKSVTAAIESSETFFSYKMTKENCIPTDGLGFRPKDLRQLLSNRDLKDIVVVDN